MLLLLRSGGFQWRVDEHGMRPLGQADDYSGGRIERVGLRTGNVVRFYDRTKNGPLRGPNNLVFDRSGGFWFADSGTSRDPRVFRGPVML